MTAPSSAILLTARPTAAGSAIAVVRIRGPGVPEFLEKYFSGRPAFAQCVHGQLRDGSMVIDDAVAVLGDGGQSADLCLHGGAWVVDRTMNLAQRAGFTIIPSALPLPPDALEDSADELEREMLQYLPLALTEPAIRMLLGQPTAWENAKHARFDPAAILNDQTLWRLLHSPRIAITGAPNVGKSTLANRLFGQQRSITADQPGTTRDWVGEIADIAGLPALLIDTPGLRETEDEIERSAIAAGGEEIRQADLLLMVLDATAIQPQPLPQSGPRQIVVVNKIDQPANWDSSTLNAVRISAKTGEDCDDLYRTIHSRLGIARLDAERPRWWTQRQREILSGALGDPASAIKAIIGESKD